MKHPNVTKKCLELVKSIRVLWIQLHLSIPWSSSLCVILALGRVRVYLYASEWFVFVAMCPNGPNISEIRFWAFYRKSIYSRIGLRCSNIMIMQVNFWHCCQSYIRWPILGPVCSIKKVNLLGSVHRLKRPAFKSCVFSVFADDIIVPITADNMDAFKWGLKYEQELLVKVF